MARGVGRRVRWQRTGGAATSQTWKDIAQLIVGDFSPWTRRVVVNGALWGWTEGQARATKYVGCRYWSRGAIAEVAARGFDNLPKRLRHEHAGTCDVLAVRGVTVGA